MILLVPVLQEAVAKLRLNSPVFYQGKHLSENVRQAENTGRAHRTKMQSDP